MVFSEYIAHIRPQDGEKQLVIDHLSETAYLAHSNAAPWGAAFAYTCGLVHDIGKYSQAFQTRINGGTQRVDHSTAGGQLLYEIGNKSKLSLLAAYCVMGHHSGLPNGGSYSQDVGDEPTLYGRLNRHIEDYSTYKNELTISPFEQFNHKWQDGFDVAFFIRMAFSALVDADWLNTEKFCEYQNAPRGGFSPLATLCEKLASQTTLFLNSKGEIGDLNRRRNELLKNCLAASKLPSGLFTLTAPTGSGKTIASLAFALNHAVRYGKQHIIYIVPYNTIIEQNAAVFEKMLGVESILRHNCDVAYDGDEEEYVRKRNSVENWDYPLIVTSNVQFFESLFANKPSKCRKLHNIANSVLIFDEAQMIPVPYLIPCVRAIKTLVTQYNCSAVLATATQSSLDKFFAPLILTEITEKPEDLFISLRRAQIKWMGNEPQTDDALTDKLLVHKQVLCIVNTRRHAQILFEHMYKITSEGTFHLSTTMFPAHRKRVLDIIRGRLKNGLVCRVISTSLVEAGVDLDFESVYREMAGLDSIVQAAGRCNREGKRKLEESVVYVFNSSGHRSPRMIQPNIGACGQVIRKYDDLASLDAIKAYFNQLHYNIGDEQLDLKHIVQMFIDGVKAGLSFPFEEVAKTFKLINDATQQTIYILHEAPELEARLRSGERNLELFRALGIYGVSLFEKDMKELVALGAVERLDESVLLLSRHYYSDQIGVSLAPEGGQALVF